MCVCAENPTYRRRIDKSEIPTCPILGVNIAAIDMQWLVAYLILILNKNFN